MRARTNPGTPVDSNSVSTPVTRVAAMLAALALSLLLAAPVAAHAELVESTPEDGAALAASPTAVELRFSEALIADRSSFRLVGPGGDVGTGQVTSDNGRVMTLSGLDLASGAYEVRWTAATDDGHIERGRIDFTVAAVVPASEGPSFEATDAPSNEPSPPPTVAPSDAPSTSASSAPSPSAGPDDEPAAGTGTDVLIPIIAALLLVSGVGAFVLRRNRGA